LRLNALDNGPGEAAFEAYGLRGHPSVVVVEPGGQVMAVHFGVVSRQDVEQSLQSALGP
jgi:hypothetical protein